MNNDLRHRLKRVKKPEKSLDGKLADFFASDEKLQKYADADFSDDSSVTTFVSKVIAIAKDSFSRLAKLVIASSKRFRKKLRGADLSSASPRALRRKSVFIPLTTIVVGIGAVLFLGSTDNNAPATGVQGVVSEPVVVEPEFTVAETDSALEPTGVAYDQDKKVASYGVSLNESTDAVISQQEITVADATRENFLLEVAQSFGINREIQSDKGPLFIGSNEKQRVVTAVFQQGTFLFFIRTNNLIEDASILTLVDELQI